MTFSINDAAKFLRRSQAPRAFRDFVAQIKRIFTFTQERANRLVRFGEVVRDYKSGVMVNDIEHKYGCSRQTVMRYARTAGLPKRPKHFDPKIRSAVIAMYQQKKPVAEIAARHGVSPAYVSKVATEEGINRRKFAKHRAGSDHSAL